MRTLIINIITSILLWAVAATAAGCNSESNRSNIDPGADVVKVRLVLSIPQTRTATRAVDETLLSEVNVVVLENTGGGFIYRYTATGYSIGDSANSDYQFSARLLPTENPVRLWLVANTAGAFGNLTEGMTEAEVREALTQPFDGIPTDGSLPMTGVISAAELVTDVTLSGTLVRAVAKADIINNATDDFTLTSVRVYRATDSIQLIPDAITNNVVSVPSIPNGATRSVVTDPIAVSGTSLTDNIYIPESALPVLADRQLTATAIVIGGRYGDETRTTYYRLDFEPDNAPELFGQVLRNHRYEFRIAEVLAPGWATDDEASVYPSTGIQAEIVVWNEVTTSMVFDDYDYFGVSSRTIDLAFRSGSVRTISVDTSLDTYTVYWSDAAGNIIPSAGSVVPGGSFESPDELFNVIISPDGVTITAEALADYDETADLPRYLKVVAGRLEILLTVTQSPPVFVEGQSRVNVIGCTGEIGSLGNWVLTGVTTNQGDRTSGLVPLLRNTANFGPAGIFTTDGIFISGLALGNTMPEEVMALYDVVYLTYARNPPASPILQWLDASGHHVLVVQFDNGSTNSNMFNELGITVTATSGRQITNPFLLADQAPDFILNGPFGVVDQSLRFRINDDTYGSMPLAEAAAHNITPILTTVVVGGDVHLVLGVDIARRIVYSGDIDLYYASGTADQRLPGDGVVSNMPAVLMANLWSWISGTVLYE